MIAKSKAIFHNFVSGILKNVSLYRDVCMSLEYLMYNSFPQASAEIDEGKLWGGQMMCVKNICINMYKRQLCKIQN